MDENTSMEMRNTVSPQIVPRMERRIAKRLKGSPGSRNSQDVGVLCGLCHDHSSLRVSFFFPSHVLVHARHRRNMRDDLQPHPQKCIHVDF